MLQQNEESIATDFEVSDSQDNIDKSVTRSKVGFCIQPNDHSQDAKDTQIEVEPLTSSYNFHLTQSIAIDQPCHKNQGVPRKRLIK